MVVQQKSETITANSGPIGNHADQSGRESPLRARRARLRASEGSAGVLGRGEGECVREAERGWAYFKSDSLTKFALPLGWPDQPAMQGEDALDTRRQVSPLRHAHT